MEKVKVPGLSEWDLQVISKAASHYADALASYINFRNNSQSHIHFSILQEFRYDLLKKLTRRDPAKKTSLKLEIHTGFVVRDALMSYSNEVDNELEAAVLGRIVMQLFPLLPFTADQEKLSVHSSINLE